MYGRVQACRSAAAALLLVGVVAGGSPALAAEREGVVRHAGAADAVPGSYLVVLKEGTFKGTSAPALAGRYGGQVKRGFDSALHGFSARLTERQARRLAADPAVASVTQDRRVKLDATQTEPPSWGLDRIDRHRRPLDNRYVSPDTGGRGVTIYVIDTGVNIEHQDFGGRARYGFNAIDGSAVAEDGNGHGSHVAATAAGTSYGVAKQASVVAVQVLDDSGEGTYEQVIAGVDWVTRNAVKPAVVNMSLGGEPDEVLDAAVRASIASGLTYTVAAGNQGIDADEHSPARVSTAITVGASDIDDRAAWYSNHGPLVDLYAPGDEIVSASDGWEAAEATLSGTSMAAPHAAGAAALHLAGHRTATPAQVAAALIATATAGSLRDLVEGTPDRLLYLGPPPATGPHPRFANPAVQPVPDPGVLDSTITVTGVPGRAPTELDVELDVTHDFMGDLLIDLIAPDGTAYRLKDGDFAWGDDAIRTTLGADTSSETANGVWTLRITDPWEYLEGQLNGWALKF
ncbi:S8 family serine peptidase [Kitasatospora sp. NPDC051853]|uniref:S8 family peptidase n=1 Tax=Kitasatospora sp. NPDC051853 TaxID=3364058 RepID=UPI00378A7018